MVLVIVRIAETLFSTGRFEFKCDRDRMIKRLLFFLGARTLARPQPSTKRSSCREATGMGRLGDQVHL